MSRRKTPRPGGRRTIFVLLCQVFIHSSREPARVGRIIAVGQGFRESAHGLAKGNGPNRLGTNPARGRSRLCRRLDHQRPRNARHHHRGLAACDLNGGPPCQRVRASLLASRPKDGGRELAFCPPRSDFAAVGDAWLTDFSHRDCGFSLLKEVPERRYACLRRFWRALGRAPPC